MKFLLVLILSIVSMVTLCNANSALTVKLYNYNDQGCVGNETLREEINQGTCKVAGVSLWLQYTCREDQQVVRFDTFADAKCSEKVTDPAEQLFDQICGSCNRDHYDQDSYSYFECGSDPKYWRGCGSTCLFCSEKASLSGNMESGDCWAIPTHRKTFYVRSKGTEDATVVERRLYIDPACATLSFTERSVSSECYDMTRPVCAASNVFSALVAIVVLLVLLFFS